MVIKVKVWPSSKKEAVVEKTADSFEVKVKEKPVQGLANRAVINLLAEYFKISNDRVKLVKGFKSRNKIFEIK